MRLVHKESGQIAVDAIFDEKFKTYTLVFEDGTQKPFSASTIKRWWKEVKDEEGTAKESEIKKQDEDVAGDGTPLSEVGKEIAEQAKQKAKAIKKTAKKVEGKSIEEAQQLVIEQIKKAGFDYVITEKSPKNIWILINGKKLSGVYIGGKKCAFGLPKDMVPNGYKADRIRNATISHSFDIFYDKMDVLSEMLSKIEITTKEER